MTICSTCETEAFCQDIHNCMNSIIFAKASEAEVQELDELTADDVNLKFQVQEGEEVKVNKKILEILKYAIQ